MTDRPEPPLGYDYNALPTYPGWYTAWDYGHACFECIKLRLSYDGSLRVAQTGQPLTEIADWFAWGKRISFFNEEVMENIKIIAFDVFGTVVDLSGVDREEVKAYAHHIRQPVWSPLVLPESWEHLPPHPDSVVGLQWLRKKYIVVTCSNAPLGTMAKLSKNAGLQWDAIIPLELNKVYKPNQKAYYTVCQVFNVKPENVLMVTANKDFGDLEGAKSIGMQSVLIRDKSASYKDIQALAADLVGWESKLS